MKYRYLVLGAVGVSIAIALVDDRPLLLWPAIVGATLSVALMIILDLKSQCELALKQTKRLEERVNDLDRELRDLRERSKEPLQAPGNYFESDYSAARRAVNQALVRDVRQRSHLELFRKWKARVKDEGLDKKAAFAVWREMLSDEKWDA